MSQTGETPEFNLWTGPWIGLLRPDGGRVRTGIRDCILASHRHVGLYDPSPLVVAGIHRLLVAVLQAALEPRTVGDLQALAGAGAFPDAPLDAFGERFRKRFGLFSPTAPFLQSADMPLHPARGDDLKSVSQLTMETSATSALDHYRHGRPLDEVFCAACAACGLVTVPAFTSTGGAGLKPSINGVPPIYVIPGGETLFESLVHSLLVPERFPRAARMGADLPCWEREGPVAKGADAPEAGYLESLTWPARRIRLHPEAMQDRCTRCGEPSRWGVRTMLFEKGLSRPKTAPPWMDPFAAYILRANAAGGRPSPVRPTEGKAVWREFAALFMKVQPRAQGGAAPAQVYIRPGILEQIAETRGARRGADLPFRCVGIRTDMKAKCFEWMDATLDMPAALLDNPAAGLVIYTALQLAERAAGSARGVFAAAFARSLKSAQYTHLRQRLVDEYWLALAEPFRRFVLDVAEAEPPQAAFGPWRDLALAEARAAFLRAADDAGSDAKALMKRAQGEASCNRRLAKLREEYTL